MLKKLSIAIAARPGREFWPNRRILADRRPAGAGCGGLEDHQRQAGIKKPVPFSSRNACTAGVRRVDLLIVDNGVMKINPGAGTVAWGSREVKGPILAPGAGIPRSKEVVNPAFIDLESPAPVSRLAR